MNLLFYHPLISLFLFAESATAPLALANRQISLGLQGEIFVIFFTNGYKEISSYFSLQ